MSALSEYFYKTSKGYRGNPWGSAESALMAQRRLNQERVNAIRTPTTLQELQNRLSIDNNIKDGEQAAAVANRRINMIDAVARSMSPNLEGRILQSFENGGNGSGASGSKREYSYESLEQLRQLRNSIASRVSYINSSPEVDHTRAVSSLIEVYKQFYEVAQSLDNSIQDVELSASNVTQEATRQAIIDIYNKMTVGTVNANVKGEFGEKLVVAASDMLYSAGLEELQKTMSEGLSNIAGATGGVKSGIYIRPEYIPSTEYEKWKGSRAELTDKFGSYYEFAQTQDKVDAQITVGGDQINASIKTYTANDSGTAYPHLQDINFTYSLMKSAENFGNHYIQLLAMSNGTGSFEDEHKSELAYEALVHGNLLKEKTTEADTFVFIDLNSGKVRSMSTKSMLEDTLGNFKFSYSTDFANALSKANRWVSAKGMSQQEAMNKRVSNLYTALRKLKISVSYTMRLSDLTN